MVLKDITELPGITLFCPLVSNSSNDSVVESRNPPLAPTHQLAGGLVVFLSILPFVLFHFRFFPVGTNVVMLLGAFLMVATAVVSQEEVYEVLGDREAITPVLLLIGMMMLLQYVERELLFLKLIRKLLKPSYCFENYLWRVTLLTFLTAAIFTSDATTAVLTPLILKYWEAQERSRQELQTLVLGIATSANIGSVLTILGSPQMVIIAAKTSTFGFEKSRLDMKMSLMYFAIPALFAYFANLGFLMLHFRIRNIRIENSHLVSEPSQSDQEMTGLTGSPRMNGHVQRENGDIHHLENSVFREDRLLAPCQLETIPEDDILEIQSIPSAAQSDNDLDTQSATTTQFSSHRSSILENNGGIAVNIDSPPDSDNDGEEEDSDGHSGHSENCQHQQLAAENVSNPSLDYRPSALTLANLQESQRQLDRPDLLSVDRVLTEHGWRLSQKLGMYRSIGGVSAVEFLPYDTGMQQLAQVESSGGSSDFRAADSRSFHVMLCLLVLIMVVLLLASTNRFPFNIGLVPIAAAGLAIMFDGLINRRPSFGILRRTDWSVVLMFLGLFVWVHGLNKTQLPRWIWTKVGLAGNSFTSAWSILLLTVTMVTGTNIFGGALFSVIVLDRLVPCEDQMSLVLYLAWCSSVAGNLTQLSSVTNLVVSQKALQAVNYRLTYWTYLKYGFLTTLVILPAGILILYCRILIPV